MRVEHRHELYVQLSRFSNCDAPFVVNSTTISFNTTLDCKYRFANLYNKLITPFIENILGIQKEKYVTACINDKNKCFEYFVLMNEETKEAIVVNKTIILRSRIPITVPSYYRQKVSSNIEEVITYLEALPY
ncbi:hypothetical protein CAP35_04725 [Chitinophagaceae bacterium IBVUCB1]|nr:hypothetical protein CAP35_04725 [Chitinophagaceae bacterium IBVUCB1]